MCELIESQRCEKSCSFLLNSKLFYLDGPEEKHWFGFALNVLGIIFVFVNIGSDIKLVFDYHYDYKYFKALKASENWLK